MVSILWHQPFKILNHFSEYSKNSRIFVRVLGLQRKYLSQITSTMQRKTHCKFRFEYQRQKEMSNSQLAGTMSQITMHITSQKNNSLTDDCGSQNTQIVIHL